MTASTACPQGTLDAMKRQYPAWRTGQRITSKGPVLHAATDKWAGQMYHSGFLALCGRSVRYKVEDVFDPDDTLSCPQCAINYLLGVEPEAKAS